MCVAFDDEDPALGPSNKVSIDNWDEEQHTSLGVWATNLKRMSLGIDRDTPTCIQANNIKKVARLEKRNVERPKCTMWKRVLGQTYE